jgi:hypothetical protein
MYNVKRELDSANRAQDGFLVLFVDNPRSLKLGSGQLDDVRECRICGISVEIKMVSCHDLADD